MKPAAAAALLCLAAAACQQHAPSVRVERTVVLMGTTATFAAAAADRAAALARLERMVRVVEATEAELSTWRDDSALSALNRQPPGEPLPLEPQLCDLLGRLAGWREATGGAFDPAIGSLVDAWDLRGAGRRPDGAALSAARARAGWPLLGLDRDNCTINRRADVTLDAGAFGKGEALDRVRAAERDHPGAWRIDFGGQVAVGGGADGAAWPLALAHPARRHAPVAELQLAGGSLATSAVSERTFTLDGGELAGHILDPRSGAPVVRPASVAVWHPNAFTADVLSTALYVMGPDAGLAWAEERGFAACFIVPAAGTDAVELLATPDPPFEQRFPFARAPAMMQRFVRR